MKNKFEIRFSTWWLALSLCATDTALSIISLYAFSNWAVYILFIKDTTRTSSFITSKEIIIDELVGFKRFKITCHIYLNRDNLLHSPAYNWGRSARDSAHAQCIVSIIAYSVTFNELLMTVGTLSICVTHHYTSSINKMSLRLFHILLNRLCIVFHYLVWSI